MLGLHITADFYQCACDKDVLTNSQHFLGLIRNKVKNVGLTALRDCTHEFSQNHFEQCGFTSVVLLAESHISVHTWPEHSYVSIDAYVCNISSDNSHLARELVSELRALFRPHINEQNDLMRGTMSGPLTQVNSGLHLEWLNDTTAFGFKATSMLEQRQSKFQFIEVLNCPQWGNTLRLDHRYMTSELEGFIYHELMVHPVMAAHRSPSTVLILGGGDGGALKEVLKYTTVSSVELVEIDEEVIAVAKKYLRAINDEAFVDGRVNIYVKDALDYLATSHKLYDLIFLDITDERPPAKHLYDKTFFALLKTKLKPNGAIVLHCGAPYIEPQAVADILGRLRTEFSIVRPFGAYIPLYGTYLMFAVASQTLDPVNAKEEDVISWLAKHRLSDLRYYNPDMHHAIFAIPNFLKVALA